MLHILHSDDHLVAINKPHGLLVHKSMIAADASEFAIQLLRDQLGRRVYPAHRLDRKTAGVLLFALDHETDSLMQQQFMRHETVKVYHAIVRGFMDEEGVIDYPLVNEKGQSQEAVTHYRRLKTAELEIPSSGFNTSRFSLVEVRPLTGRMHQIRKHLAHVFHPIIGDRPHGCNKQNRLFLEHWNHNDMLLHAVSLEFTHPVSGEKLKITASYQDSFQHIMKVMGF
ncbi:MAG: tRNA pseudouridine65 synthase [Bacteroidetes bacterium]|nr:MAG: tRNA pseudouridine65 synthase [Bacteroidota bacterium]